MKLDAISYFVLSSRCKLSVNIINRCSSIASGRVGTMSLTCLPGKENLHQVLVLKCYLKQTQLYE